MQGGVKKTPPNSKLYCLFVNIEWFIKSSGMKVCKFKSISNIKSNQQILIKKLPTGILVCITWFALKESCEDFC